MLNKNFITTVVLVVLVIISAVQAVQLNALKGALEEGDLSVGTKSSSVTTASGGSSPSGGSLPANIQDLPTMVGGC